MQYLAHIQPPQNANRTQAHRPKGKNNTQAQNALNGNQHRYQLRGLNERHMPKIRKALMLKYKAKDLWVTKYGDILGLYVRTYRRLASTR